MLDVQSPKLVLTNSDLDLPVTTDRRRWASSILVTGLFAGVAVLYSFWLAGVIYGTPFWMAPRDSWMILDGARFVARGALPYVYQGTGSYALPGSFIAYAPIAWLVDHLHLVEGAPMPVRYASAWPAYLAYSLIFCVFFLHAVRALAWDLGLRSRLLLVQILAAAMVLVPTYYWGHFEDALALIFVLHSVRHLLKGDYRRAAICLSVGVACKQDVLTLIPLLVFMAPAGRRVRTAVEACALPGALALLCLSLDWSDAHRALFDPINLTSHYQGHSFFYVTWLGAKTSQYSRSAGVLVCVGLAWLLRKANTPVQILGAVSLILLVRPLSEAINYSYYWSPALLVAGLIGVAAHGRIRFRDWVWPVLALVWTSPRGAGSFQPWWWAGETPLILLAMAQTMANCGIQLRWPARSGHLIKKIAQPPIIKDMSAPLGAGETTWIQ